MQQTAEKEYIKTIRKKIGHDTLIFCGASVIIHKGSKVLLQRRKDSGLWAAHGGCVEVGEEVEAAAKRELWEETGLTANKLEFFSYESGKDMLHIYPNGDSAYIVDIVFTCDDFTGEPAKISDETTDLKWFDISALPEGLHPIDKKVLTDFQIAQNKKDNLSMVIYGLEYALANGGIKNPTSIIADDFMEFGSSGKIFYKKDVVETVLKRSHNNMKISDFKIKLIEENTALATYRGIKKESETLRSSIWKFKGGSWHIIFHQGTKI